MLNRKIIFISSLVGAFFSQMILAEMPLEDRILDLEAQVEALKEESRSAKALAEQEKPSAFNPRISVIGDVLGQYGHNVEEKPASGNEHAHHFQNGLMVRELEFEFRGEIDPWADALVAVAIEQHAFNHIDIHLEEAYARLKKLPGFDVAPFGMTLRAGKFKTAIGRMNRIHLHNAPQITYPLAMKVFLGDEGFASQGLSLNSTVAINSTSALTWTLEGVTGSKLPMQREKANKIPMGIAHLWWHQELNSTNYLDFGFSSLIGRKGKEDSGVFSLLGGDVHYSYLPHGYGQNPVFLAGSEIYAANALEDKWPIGNFTWLQSKLWGSSFAGIRYDVAPNETKFDEYQHALGAYVGFYTTEFLRFRLGYEHVMPKLNSFDGDHRIMLSMNFILGSHPVEPYFANR